MAASTAKLRRQLIDLLLSDRQAALKARNPAAAVSASSRVVHLVLKQAEEDAAKTTPLTTLRTVVLHQVMCPVCREKQPVTEHPPAPSISEAEAARLRRARAWTEADAELDPAPAAPAPTRQPEAVLKVPKTPQQMRRRRDGDGVTLKGIL